MYNRNSLNDYSNGGRKKQQQWFTNFYLPPIRLHLRYRDEQKTLSSSTKTSISRFSATVSLTPTLRVFRPTCFDSVTGVNTRYFHYRMCARGDDVWRWNEKRTVFLSTIGPVNGRTVLIPCTGWARAIIKKLIFNSFRNNIFS